MSIWKTGNLQKADTRKQILFYAGGGRFPYYGWSHPNKGVIGTWVYDDVQKWCYVDDLIAQADKAKRLQKAVDLAVDYLEQVATHAKSEEDNFAAQVIKRKIDEIKQLIKE